LLDLVERGEPPAGPAFDLIFIAHNLERLADHGTNIAEDVLFPIKESTSGIATRFSV